MRKIPVVLNGAGRVYGPGEVTILLLEPAEDPDDHALVERAVWTGFEVRPAGVVL